VEIYAPFICLCFFFPMPQLLVLIARLSALGERDRKDVIAINKRFGNKFYARVHLGDGDVRGSMCMRMRC